MQHLGELKIQEFAAEGFFLRISDVYSNDGY